MRIPGCASAQVANTWRSEWNVQYQPWPSAFFGHSTNSQAGSQRLRP